jgi:ABC-type glycerol-3-phosphate transport system substrate-binding protein
LSEKKVSRRKFIYAGAGVVVVAAAAGAAYYLSLPSAAPQVTTTVASASTAATSTAASASAATQTPLTFVHWHYRDDVVAGYVKQFESEMNETVVEETLDNANYNPLIETKFQAGEVIDMNYANAFEAFRLVKLGRTQDVESFPEISQIKSEMYPSVVEAYSTADGKLAGLPYFWSARSCPVVDDDVLTKAGMAGQRPGTWDELWDMAAKIKKTGVVQYPVLPHWFTANYGIVWDFLAEMSNVYDDPDLTKTLFAKDFSPIFDVNTEVADLLTKWASVTKAGLVDPTIFSMGGDDPMVTASLTGNYAFVPTAIYYFKSMNDPTASRIPVGSANLVPVTKQAWGVIDTGIYCWPKVNHDPDRSQKLMKFFGWKDPTSGKRLTATAWAKSDALSSGYTDTLQDPDVIAAFKSWLGDRTDATLKTINDIAVGMGRPRIWKSALYTPWADLAFPILSSVASGVVDVKTGVTKLRSAADTLYKQYEAHT